VPVTLDSVQEFRVITSNANADMGRSAGAQVSLVTRSGSNQWHGSVYEFHRNTIFTTNNYFNNSAGRFEATDSAVISGEANVGDERLPRPKLIRNVFGFSLGGPFIKDKFFFFVNYEGQRDASEESEVRIVPIRTSVVVTANSSSDPAAKVLGVGAGVNPSSKMRGVCPGVAEPLPSNSRSDSGKK